MIERIKNQNILPILRGVSEEDAFFLAESFLEVDINILEVSVNQPDSFKLIEKLNEKFGQELTVGAGTVINSNIALKAIDYGASFFLSPSFSLDVAKTSNRLDIPYIPGALTSTEIQQSYEAGADLIKLFPVRQLGPSYIKDVLSSLNHVDLLAVGGININNVGSWFEAGVKGVGVGGNLIPKNLIESREKNLTIQRLKGFQSKISEAKGDL